MADALIISGFGVNCEYETAFAFSVAGAKTRIVHLNDIISGKVNIDDYHIIAFPGGFSFGDDIGSGKVFANKIRYNLKEKMQKFIDDKKLIIGMCNGFQSMVKLGLLPGFEKDYFSQKVTLTFNDSGRFENRWVYLKINNKKCIFTKNIKQLYLVVRHGEGKFVPMNEEVRKRIQKNHVVAQYTDEKGNIAGYPYNPNGSVDNIGGICDETGRIFGLMPHPEAFNHATNHPRWTREKISEPAGLQIFRNAVEYIDENF